MSKKIMFTRMHSSRMRTARSLIVSPYLVVSHARPPRSNHVCPPVATMHAPRSNHARPPPREQPCTPPAATTHAPPLPRTPRPPPVNRITRLWKYNLAPTSLRAVKISRNDKNTGHFWIFLGVKNGLPTVAFEKLCRFWKRNVTAY